MAVGLSSLVGDLLLTDTNRDVYKKTVAKSSDVNDWGASVVLHADKKRETGNYLYLIASR
jgi:hypothetical protein